MDVEVSHDQQANQYLLTVTYPDGTIAYVALPHETDDYVFPSLAQSRKNKPVGLNLVTDGHYT